MTTGQRLDTLAKSLFGVDKYDDLARDERDEVFRHYLRKYAVRVRPESMTEKRDRAFFSRIIDHNK